MTRGDGDGGNMPEPADKTAETMPPERKKRRNWLSFSLRSLMILLTLCCLALGGKLKYDWYQKKWLVEKWVAQLVTLQTAQDPTLISPTNWIAAPAGIKAEDEAGLLQFGILELDTSLERFAALKILVESRKEDSLPLVRELIPKSRHPEMQAMLLHVVSLARDPKDVPRIEPYLRSRLPEVRGAAAEAIGYIHEPSFQLGGNFGLWSTPSELNTNPSVDVSFLVGAQLRSDEDVISPASDRLRRFPAGTRSRLEALMLQGESLEERTAAARALVPWPPADYKLRLAEWGVWIDGPGKLEVAKSVLDEIPPFVHRTGNLTASLSRNRYDGIMFVTKPIIHLTSEQPLAVDLEVAIRSGRPWYAYPRPDGFTMHSGNMGLPLGPEMSASDLATIEPRDLSILDPVSEGYPWIHSTCRSDHQFEGQYGSGEPITAIGFRWQSLIVSPSREPWMTIPEVPDQRGYAWWTSLRDVPSAWITSQGETERFLYYDGPTLAKSPVSARFDTSELHLRTRDLFSDRFKEQDRKNLEHVLQNMGQSPERDCLFVEGSQNSARGFSRRISTALGREETLKLADQRWLPGDDLEKTLLAILLQRGLTGEEAEGLIASWREKFFQNPGKRLLTFLTPAEYDRMCPLEIRPKTTEQVRVGIVLTEL
ncbi:MAG: HEAT repeat domain-containing protein [Pirellulaceae bacterium]|nr:HEAT repeat domain-containing protein [Pirellulaceae bacterium]